MNADLTDHVLPHVGRDDLAERMVRFYDDVDAAIATHAPICRNRGDCCKFDVFGHKLYITAIELAYFLHGMRMPHHSPDDAANRQSPTVNLPSSIGRTCPYHVAGRCLARRHRPLGCRIFFCDPDTRGWQEPEYERRLGELKRIGDDLAVDYRYVEWLSAIQLLAARLTGKK